MTTYGSYGSPASLRQALEARLRQEAERAGIDLQRLRRQATFERLLVRLEQTHPGRWILKGGMAMELRLGERARTTRDLDLAVRDVASGADTRDLLVEAAGADLDDGFSFRISVHQQLNPDESGRPGWRFSVEALMAGRTFAEVRVDVVARTEEVVATERLRLPDTLAFAGISTANVESVTTDQHFAEKLHALTREYGDGRPSSRVRDLPDLMLLIGDGLKPDRALLQIVETVFDVRATHPVPTELPDPPAGWAPVYAAIAAEVDLEAKTIESAMHDLRWFWARTRGTREDR